MPEASMMNPEPSDADRGDGELGPPGAPFSLKKSRKNSSSGVPGDGPCASGAPLATGAAVTWVVEMLTTTPTSRAASCAKIFENGTSGASALLGMDTLKDKSSNTARMTAREPNNATISLLHTSSRLRTLGLLGRRSRAGVSVALDMKWRRA